MLVAPPPQARPARPRRGGTRLGLVLAVIVALVALGSLGAWLLLRQPQATGTGAGTAVAERRDEADGDSPRPSAEARDLDGAAERSEVGDRATRPADPAASTGRENFDLDDAGWIAGRVLLPAGVPPDETLRVLTASRATGPALESSAASHWLEQLADPQARERIAWRPVEVDGSFRVPVPAGVRRAALQVDGRYLYLEAARVVDAGASELELIPSLGGWLVVQLQLPAQLPADIDPSGIVGGRAVLSGFRMSGAGGQMAGRAARVDERHVVEFRGVPTGWTLAFTARVRRFVPLLDFGWAVTVGQRTDKLIDLEVGVRASGTVFGPDGAPVEGAQLSCSDGRGIGFESARTEEDALSGADGSFVLYGARPGTHLELTAALDGYADGSVELGDRRDGARVEGLELRLQAGLGLVGRVQFPDGRPARGAEVAVWTREEELAYAVEPNALATVDAQGAFAFRGLEGELCFVRAAADESGATVSEYVGEGEEDPFGILRWQRELSRSHEDSSSEFAGRWRAHAADVEPGTDTPLVLEVRAPCSMSGSVVDDLGAPVTSFRVRAVARTDATTEARGQTLQRSFEDADGRFELPGLEAGSWSLTALAAGHQDATPVILEMPGAAALELVLTRSAALRGAVVDPSGLPVAGANVTTRGSGGLRTATNVDGTFELLDVPPGTVVLEADHDAFAPSAPLQLEVVAGEELAELTLELLAGGGLRGVIYRADGTPDPDRTILLLDLAGSGGGLGVVDENTVSNAEGRFELHGLSPGTYQVMAQPDFSSMSADAASDPVAMMEQMKMESVEIRAGEVSEVVLGAQPADPVDVRGVVTEAGRAVAGSIIMALVEGDSVLSNMKMATTDAGGNYALTVPQPGLYSFMVMSEMGGDDGVEFPVSIPQGGEARVDLALPLGAIEGRVSDGAGRAVESARVRLQHDQALSSLMDMDGGRDVVTDAEGRFAFAHLNPGTYTLRALGPRGEEGGRGRGLRSGVAVAADESTAGIELSLVAPGVVVGTVRDAAGEPAANASVFVRDDTGRLIDLVTDVSTDKAGRFEYRDAPSGAITVSASKGAETSAESVAFSLAAGGEVEVELTLEAGTTLVLSLEDLEGNTLRAHVEVLDEAGRDWSLRGGGDLLARTLTEGFSSTERRIGPLPPGEYRVTARTTDGRASSKPVKVRGQEERRVRLRLREE